MPPPHLVCFSSFRLPARDRAGANNTQRLYRACGQSWLGRGEAMAHPNNATRGQADPPLTVAGSRSFGPRFPTLSRDDSAVAPSSPFFPLCGRMHCEAAGLTNKACYVDTYFICAFSPFVGRALDVDRLPPDAANRHYTRARSLHVGDKTVREAALVLLGCVPFLAPLARQRLLLFLQPVIGVASQRQHCCP